MNLLTDLLLLCSCGLFQLGLCGFECTANKIVSLVTYCTSIWIFMLDTDSWSSLICLSLAFCSSWVICIRCSNLSVSAELLVDSSFAFSSSFSEFSRAFCISANLLSGDPPLYTKKKVTWKNYQAISIFFFGIYLSRENKNECNFNK